MREGTGDEAAVREAVGAYAKSRFERSFSSAAGYDDEMYSARLRVLYLF